MADIRFTIDLEKINEMNGANKATAFFKYMKSVSRNKTPIVLKGVKENNNWKCTVYECAIPSSKFTEIILPAINDLNPEGQKLCVNLTTKLLDSFSAGYEFTFKETEVVIRSGRFKVRDSYETSMTEVEAQLNEFLGVIETEVTEPTLSWEIDENSNAVKYLQNLASNPEAAMYVDEESITLKYDSFFFRTKNSENFKTNNFPLYINMYLANKILNYFDYCDKLKVVVDNNIFIMGYLGEQEIVRNVSSIFDPEFENPSDEDLESIKPSEGAVEATVDFEELQKVFDGFKDKIHTFINSKNYEVKLYKNGEGISFELEQSGEITGSKTLVSLHVGEVETEDVEEEKFTTFAVMLPLNVIKNILEDNKSLTIIYDDNDETAVSFVSGDYCMLSGKLI